MESDQSDASERGFEAMKLGKQKQVGSEGGRAPRKNGTAHGFDSNEAREADKNEEQAGDDNKKQNRSGGRKGREEWGGYKGY